MPILGTIASSYFQSTSAFFSIETKNISSDTASVTFSSIPQTYTHLQLRGITRSTRTDSTSDNINFQFNGDTGNNYSWNQIYGQRTASNTDNYGLQALTNINYTWVPFGSVGQNNLANQMGTFICDILDYTNTNKYKQTRGIGSHGGESNKERCVAHGFGVWQNTAAVSSITCFAIGSLRQYSTIALYGIKS